MWVGDKRFLDLPLGPFRISDGSGTRRAATFRGVLGGICVGLLCATTALGQASLGELNASIAQLAEEVLPGVVQIESNSYAPILGAGNSAPVALQPSTGIRSDPERGWLHRYKCPRGVGCYPDPGAACLVRRVSRPECVTPPRKETQS